MVRKKTIFQDEGFWANPWPLGKSMIFHSKRLNGVRSQTWCMAGGSREAESRRPGLLGVPSDLSSSLGSNLLNIDLKSTRPLKTSLGAPPSGPDDGLAWWPDLALEWPLFLGMLL